MDEKAEEAWENEQRLVVVRYLAHESELSGLVHGAVGEGAAWLLAPYVSIWAVKSIVSQGRVGWWAIAGDLPTDYLSGSEASDPRSATRAFALRWRRLVGSGGVSEGVRVGSPANWLELSPLLESRAELLLEWVEDDSLWS